jgi:pyruvate ferredoxin oxidoreductase alpha subunit
MQHENCACRAVADAIALCGPDVICAHANATPSLILGQLHESVRPADRARWGIVKAPSDFAAMSVAIDASTSGSRTYTLVRTGQGLLFAAESLYDAAGRSLPIVLTIGDCSEEPPVNEWIDHLNSMWVRDAGWIQLYAETNQNALDLHIQAFRLAETLSCPVMVCIDGFEDTGPVDVPSQAQVDEYLPPIRASRNGRAGTSVDATAAPLPRTEMRYLAHHKQLRALRLIPLLANEWLARFGRQSGGLIRTHLTEDAETIVVAIGAINATIRAVTDDLRGSAGRFGSVSICSFRPFPLNVFRDAVQNARRIVVVEQSLAVGMGGILCDAVRNAVMGTALKVYTVIAGLGGRAITPSSLRQVFVDAGQDELEQLTFLDLNADVVARHLERETRTDAAAFERKWT